MPLLADFEKRLTRAADELWTNSSLEPSKYCLPVLALVFLKYADQSAHAEGAARGRRRPRALEVPERARFSRLAALPEGADLGRALRDAMRSIEAVNPRLEGALPRDFGRIEARAFGSLLALFDAIPSDVAGDAFGRIYEHFLGSLAPRVLQKGGEFYTPSSVVRLLVEILEPYGGSLYDPACGSGGMFVQSARFIARRRGAATRATRIFGVEKAEETSKLARMNLAVHGLTGDVRSGCNSYYDDPHDAVGRFSFVMANPPFNQGSVDLSRIRGDTRRYPFGMPSKGSANYLWIQLCYSSLRRDGRAGFVMANGAADARGKELEIRKKLVDTGAVDVLVGLTTNLFYTVTLPVTLWFLDRAKAGSNDVLFIDARRLFRQVDRAHRELAPGQIELLANIVRLRRGEPPEDMLGSSDETRALFPKGRYEDVPGLCKIVSRREIGAQGYSLNPGRYVGVGAPAVESVDLHAAILALREELVGLTARARELETALLDDVACLLQD
jgi:type I restriction enzyme M protein